MKLKVWLGIVLLAACSAAAIAQQQQKEMSAEEKAMMEAWMKAATPGDAQKKLDGMTGTWSVKVSSWMAPGAPPMISEGTAESRWILGGRYIEQRFKGSFMGAPFEGLGYLGYDNVKQKYWGTWVDNMSTGVMASTGTSTDGKVWMFTGTMADPMTGKDAPFEEKVTVTDRDHHKFELWSPGPDGKMAKTMEIEYSRKK